jgi:hypothetical protein
MTSSQNDENVRDEPSQRLSRQSKTSLAGAVANLNSQQPIGKDNIGHQLLRKMGWENGQPLGRQRNHNSHEKNILTEPIRVTYNIGTKGLGF